MAVDTTTEQLYQHVELVRGPGDRRRGRFCLMSFVALLAGEPHSDNPVTASPVIRRFAITINDAMPARVRRALKPFALRIVGTHDELDPERAAMLAAAIRNEVLPRLREDMGARRSLLWLCARTCFLDPLSLAGHPGGVAKAWSTGSTDVERSRGEDVAALAAHLLSQAARSVPRRDSDWYCSKAIELLDRLCDFRETEAYPCVSEDGIAWLEGWTAARDRHVARRRLGQSALHRLRRMKPSLAQ